MNVVFYRINVVHCDSRNEQGHSAQSAEAGERVEVVQVQKKELLYEDKAKKGSVVENGVVNNRRSNFMFRLLEEQGILTHFVEGLNERKTNDGAIGSKVKKEASQELFRGPSLFS